MFIQYLESVAVVADLVTHMQDFGEAAVADTAYNVKVRKRHFDPATRRSIIIAIAEYARCFIWKPCNCKERSLTRGTDDCLSLEHVHTC